MLTKTILKNILNVKHTAIDDVNFNADGSISVKVHPTKGEQCRCGLCGKKVPLYDSGRGIRRWRSCDWNTNMVYLEAQSPRVRCPEHGVVTSAVPWARHGSEFTYDFEQQVTWLAVNCSKKVVSAFMRIAWHTVGSIISRVKKDIDSNPEHRFENLVNIGVDETSYRKGHKYLTVVVDHDKGKVVWVCKGHGKEVFTKFFKLLTAEQLSNIKLVSADGAKWIAKCVSEFCPDAKRCIDPFHVVEWATEALDNVRREAWHDAKAKASNNPKHGRDRPSKGDQPVDTTAKDLKGSRYALDKAPENLTATQMAQLEMIAKSDKKLYRAYLLKEELRLVFQQDAANGKIMLNHWIKWAQRSRIPVFVELQKKIRRHYDAIIATLENHLSNARIEAINNKIKLSIRMAYGFRNMDNMLDTIMLRCSDIDVKLPWQLRLEN